MHRSQKRSLSLLAALAIAVAGCSGQPGGQGTASSAAGPAGAAAGCTPPASPVLTLAAYSTPREAYGKIIPAFQAAWKKEHNQTVIIQESYGGSTAQAQNIVSGFEADIAALSLAPDIDILVKAGLVDARWAAGVNGAMVSSSVVVFNVRPGNPEAIRDYADLGRPGLEVLTPDPASSGGARWNIVAAYGAAMGGRVDGYPADKSGAQSLLQDIFTNVTVLDKTARDSIKNFEAGNGDVAITYENEILVAQKAGLPDEMVIPPATVLIENPVTIVDAYADKHCVREVAEGFVAFLHGDEAQNLFKTVGFLRPAARDAAAAGDGALFAPIAHLFTVQDLGGWGTLTTDVFGEPDGVFTRAFSESRD